MTTNTTRAASHAARRCAIAVLATALAWAPVARAGGVDGVGASSEVLRDALSHHTLHTLDGRTLTLGSLRGQVVVVNFWASWCPPCRRELPGLAALHRELARSGGQVLAISIDQDVRNVQRFLATRGVSLPVAQDGPDGLAKQLNLQHVPLTLVLDRNGEVAYSVGGGDAAAMEHVAATARKLLAQAPAVSQAVPGGTP